MVDTQRDLPTLKSLLADNTTGQVSPQDLRDMLVSLDGVFGHLMFLQPLTVIVMTAAQTILKPWTASGIGAGVTRDATNGRMTVLTEGTYFVTFNVSCDIPPDLAPAVPCFLGFALCKNGLTTGFDTGATYFGIPENSPASPASDRKIHSGNFGVPVECVAGDYLEICHTASQDNGVRIWHANWTVERWL